MSNCIHPTAKLGLGLQLGHNIVIGENVVVGDNSIIGHGAVLHADTKVGANVRIDDYAVIGKLPMVAAASAVTKVQTLEGTVLGDNCIVGTHAVIYRGALISNKVMVADMASVREDVEIGERTIIGRGVTVENKVRIGSFCKIETEAYVTALSTIEDYCFVAPEVTFTNDNFLGRTKDRFKYHKGPTLKKGARIGANSTLLPGVVIEEDGLVAAGSIVTRDVPQRITVMGTPAHSWRDVPQDQLLENQ